MKIEKVINESNECDDWVKLLCCEIVRVAIEDFKKSIKDLNKSYWIINIQNNKTDIKEIIRFFKSKWYETICNIDRSIFLKELARLLEKNKVEEHKEFYEKMIKECV